MAVHESFLEYRGFRFLKAAAGLVALSILLYVLYTPIGPHNGGTWLGYGLGTVGLVLIGWLTYLGVRKRQYDLGPVKLKAWVSAHVYLGLSLLVVGTLHTGFQFGWNVHTLAYALMVVVIASGIWGVYAYVRYPTLMTANRGGQTLDAMMRSVAELDRQCRDLAMGLGDEVARVVLDSQQNTVIGGGAWTLLSGKVRGCPTARAVDRVEDLAKGTADAAADKLASLLSLLRRKAGLLRRIRKDLQYRALMEVWLYVHVPLSVALLAALLVHVFAVFFYW